MSVTYGTALSGGQNALDPPTWPALPSVWQQRAAVVDIATAVARARAANRSCARAGPIRIRGPTTRARGLKKAIFYYFFKLFSESRKLGFLDP